MRAFSLAEKKFDGKLYEVREIETVKDIIDYTSSKYHKYTAYMYKEVHGEPFIKLSYGEFKDMMDALGTQLISMGLKGANISVIGDNSHRWALSYFTTVCGVGTIVPIDKNLEPEEIENLLKRADVRYIFSGEKQLEKLSTVFENVPTLEGIAVLESEVKPEEAQTEDEIIDVEFTEVDADWTSDTTEELVEQAELDWRGKIVRQDELIFAGQALLEQCDDSYISAVVEPEDISTIIFTSGTTGMAKGVMLSHRNLAKNVQHMSEYFHAPKKARALSILPMHHAYEMTCTIITAFYQAATVVICEGLRHIQPNFNEAECSIMLGVPLVFENIHKKIFRQAEKSGEAEQLQKGLAFSKKWGIGESKFLTGKIFKSIRSIFGDELYMLIVGGAAIDPAVVSDFRAMGMPIIQGYGMTECAPLISVNPDRFCIPESAGLPLPGTTVKVIEADENGIGELVVQGPSVMKGYYNDPEATAATIVDGWLHTGDFGYLDSDGFVYITGRKKNVIVTKGGKNIFPEEIEFCLLQNEEIADVIVYGKENILKDDLACTAIIQPNFKLLKSQGITEAAAIYEKLRDIVENANDKVPAYKRVKRIEIREADFIKTTTLKIKRFEKENYEYKYDDKDFNEGRRF